MYTSDTIANSQRKLTEINKNGANKNGAIVKVRISVEQMIL